LKARLELDVMVVIAIEDQNYPWVLGFKVKFRFFYFSLLGLGRPFFASVETENLSKSLHSSGLLPASRELAFTLPENAQTDH
jgi:hypothetical protein